MAVTDLGSCERRYGIGHRRTEYVDKIEREKRMAILHAIQLPRI